MRAFFIVLGFKRMIRNFRYVTDSTQMIISTSDEYVLCYALNTILFLASSIRSKRPEIVIAYASVTGNVRKWANELGLILCAASNVHFVDTFSSNALSPIVLEQIKSSLVTIFVTSTQGNGELPSQAQKCISFLFEQNGDVFAQKSCSVLGFGSSAYPIFCGGAAYLSKLLAQYGAVEVIPRGKCDAVKGEAPTFYDWVRST